MPAFFLLPAFRFPGTRKKEALHEGFFSELMTGFEPVTSSLPRMRSTD